MVSSSVLDTVNMFIEDTCVLAAIAYTAARGRLLEAVCDPRRDRTREIMLGLLYGLIAATEAVFPGDRAPYITSGLMISLAVVLGTTLVGVETAAIAILAFLALGMQKAVIPSAACLAGSLATSAITEKGKLPFYLRGVIVASVGQAFWVIALLIADRLQQQALLSIPANAFGSLIILFILHDARLRSQSARNQVELQRMQTLMREAQLQDLRSRIHPHFMFNALTSIAALCRIDPSRAQRAVSSLGQVLRRALDASPSKLTSVSNEIEYVKSYLEIEQMRLGKRLSVNWKVDPFAVTALIPEFALQTLVENAIIHGISRRQDAGELTIRVSRTPHRTVLGVQDSGPGFAQLPVLDDESASHGLGITNQRLTLLCGPRSRLRFFSRLNGGSVVAFSVPNVETMVMAS